MPFTEKDIQYLKALAHRKGYKVKLINNTAKTDKVINETSSKNRRKPKANC